ncbi:unnamed protein product, partial [Amoebophrya sp. A25]|eukprot:GSA25T00006732001.1
MRLDKMLPILRIRGSSLLPLPQIEHTRRRKASCCCSSSTRTTSCSRTSTRTCSRTVSTFNFLCHAFYLLGVHFPGGKIFVLQHLVAVEVRARKPDRKSRLLNREDNPEKILHKIVGVDGDPNLLTASSVAVDGDIKVVGDAPDPEREVNDGEDERVRGPPTEEDTELPEEVDRD